MQPVLDKYREYSTEHLLNLRARGKDALVLEAHRAIEVVLQERGVVVPPLSTSPITPGSKVPSFELSVTARYVLIGLVVVVVFGVSNALEKTWVGQLIGLLYLAYLVVDWLRRQGLTEEQRNAEEIQTLAQKDGLTALMQAAGDGNELRVRELLANGAAVDERSFIGTTALMYAARNNQMTVVSLLLEAGADGALRTPKGSRAADFAARAGHVQVVDALRNAASTSDV